MKALGIDPGITGGWAIVDGEGLLLAAGDIPAAGAGTKRMVSGALFRAVIDEWRPDRAIIEEMSTRKNEAPQRSMRFGQGGGILQGVTEAMLVPLDTVHPATWKRHFKLIGKEKEDSRLLVLRKWPAQAALFARKSDHGRAEAALLALYSIETSRAPAEVTF